MAAQSTLKNMVLCLSVVCLVCSAILGGAYALTKEPIAAAQVAKTNASVATVLPAFDGNAVEGSIEVGGTEYSYYAAPGAGYAIVTSANGFSGPVVVMVGINESGIVHNTVVLSHSETPGLGAKCKDDEKFLSQFRGLDPSATNITVKKDGGDIDAITASTITSRAYSAAVVTAVEVYKAIVSSSNGGGQNE